MSRSPYECGGEPNFGGWMRKPAGNWSHGEALDEIGRLQEALAQAERERDEARAERDEALRVRDEVLDVWSNDGVQQRQVERERDAALALLRECALWIGKVALPVSSASARHPVQVSRQDLLARIAALLAAWTTEETR